MPNLYRSSHNQSFLSIVAIASWLLSSTTACSKLTRYGIGSKSSEALAKEQKVTHSLLHSSSDDTIRLLESIKWEPTLKQLGRDLECKYIKSWIPNTKTKLYYAAWTRDIKSLRRLCNARKNFKYLKTAIDSGVTPLHLAVYQNFDEGIDLLIKLGVRKNCLIKEIDIQPIHIAASLGSLSSIKHLLDAGASVKDTDANGQTALHWAARYGRTNCVRELLREGSNPNSRDDHNETPLCLAFRFGHILSVKELIRSGADLDCPHCMEADSHSLLCWAVKSKYLDCIEAIIKRTDFKLNISWKDRNGVSLLTYALQANNTSLLRLLLSGQDEITYRDLKGNTLLHIAAKENIAGVIPYLSQLIYVNEVNNDKHTALHLASEVGHLSVVQALLAALSIDVNAKDKDGYTPLCMASFQDRLLVVEALLCHPAIDVNTKNKLGWTLLHSASCRGDLSAVKSLLSHRALDVNTKDEDGWTSLHIASFYGHPSVVEALLDHSDTLVNEKNKNGWTPLHSALLFNGSVSNGSVSVVQLLLDDPNILVNEKNNAGHTPLYIASRKGDLSAVKSLLAHSAILVNEKDENGWTPLHSASSHGHLSVVQALLGHPAIDVSEKDECGSTALDFAVQERHQAIVEALRGFSQPRVSDRRSNEESIRRNRISYTDYGNF